MDTQITTRRAPVTIVPAGATGNQLSRLGKFDSWLQGNGHTWDSPDLAQYRNHLLERITPRSAQAHLSTIRARYKAIARDNRTRDALYHIASERFESVADRKAYVDESITRLENAIHPSASKVTVETVQDQVDSNHIRLTIEQAQALIDAPGLIPLKRLRDTAIISLMLSTGIREQELCNIMVQDLRQTVNGVLCLHVRQGKGAKTRAIPYGALDGCLAVVDKWMQLAKITEGFVFRGLYKGGHKLRPGKMNARVIQRILKEYPIAINGDVKKLCPHDLRRSYAHIMHDLGMGILAISQNLGHSSISTTQGYIGDLHMSDRAPKRAFSFDLSTLDKMETQGRLD